MRIPVSDVQAYKQFGNSVVVPVVEAVARHMFPYIMNNSETDLQTNPVYRQSILPFSYA